LGKSKSLPGISPSHEGSSGRPIQPRPQEFGEKNIGYSTSSWILDDFGGFQWISRGNDMEKYGTASFFPT